MKRILVFPDGWPAADRSSTVQSCTPQSTAPHDFAFRTQTWRDIIAEHEPLPSHVSNTSLMNGVFQCNITNAVTANVHHDNDDMVLDTADMDLIPIQSQYPGPDIRPPQRLSYTVPPRRQIRRRSVLNPQRDDIVLMRRAIDLAVSYVTKLPQSGSDPIRFVHSELEGRQYSVLSANVVDGGHRQVYWGFMWQHRARPQRAICVTIEPDQAADDEELKLQVTCSCNRISPTQCEHSQALMENERLVAFITSSMLSTTQYFGTALKPKDAFPTVQLIRSCTTTRIDAGRDKRTSLWTFWVVFDIDRLLYVPVLKRRRRLFECQLCRVSERKGVSAPMKITVKEGNDLLTVVWAMWMVGICLLMIGT